MIWKHTELQLFGEHIFATILQSNKEATWINALRKSLS
jgi:hypothetical protein